MNNMAAQLHLTENYAFWTKRLASPSEQFAASYLPE